MSNAVKYFDQLPTKLKNFFIKYPPSVKYATKPTSIFSPQANPFIANRNPITGVFHSPRYSLRRLSDVYKLAKRYGIEDMLPSQGRTKKLFFEDKYENKKFMKGVLLPKGHKYELQLVAKKVKMAKGIKDADKTILNVKGKKYAARLERKSKENQRNWV